jgi:hypothetical protein
MSRVQNDLNDLRYHVFINKVKYGEENAYFHIYKPVEISICMSSILRT